jgi:hypothetical protein
MDFSSLGFVFAKQPYFSVSTYADLLAIHNHENFKDEITVFVEDLSDSEEFSNLGSGHFVWNYFVQKWYHRNFENIDVLVSHDLMLQIGSNNQVTLPVIPSSGVIFSADVYQQINVNGQSKFIKKNLLSTLVDDTVTVDTTEDLSDGTFYIKVTFNAVQTLINGFLDMTVTDDVPTQGSTNFLTSGAIYDFVKSGMLPAPNLSHQKEFVYSKDGAYFRSGLATIVDSYDGSEFEFGELDTISMKSINGQSIFGSGDITITGTQSYVTTGETVEVFQTFDDVIAQYPTVPDSMVIYMKKIYVVEVAGHFMASKMEDPENTGTYINIWKEIS